MAKSNLIKNIALAKEEGKKLTADNRKLLSTIFEHSASGLLNLNYHCGTNYHIKNKVVFPNSELPSVVIIFLWDYLAPHDEYILLIENQMTITADVKAKLKRAKTDIVDPIHSIKKGLIARILGVFVLLLICINLQAQEISSLSYGSAISNIRQDMEISVLDAADVVDIEPAALVAIESNLSQPSTDLHNEFAALYFIAEMNKEEHHSFFSGNTYYNIYPNRDLFFNLNPLIMNASKSAAKKQPVPNAKKLSNLEMHVLFSKKAAAYSTEMFRQDKPDGLNEYDEIAAYYYSLLSDLEKEALDY